MLVACREENMDRKDTNSSANMPDDEFDDTSDEDTIEEGQIIGEAEDDDDDDDEDDG